MWDQQRIKVMQKVTYKLPQPLDIFIYSNRPPDKIRQFWRQSYRAVHIGGLEKKSERAILKLWSNVPRMFSRRIYSSTVKVLRGKCAVVQHSHFPQTILDFHIASHWQMLRLVSLLNLLERVQCNPSLVYNNNLCPLQNLSLEISFALRLQWLQNLLFSQPN